MNTTQADPHAAVIILGMVLLCCALILLAVCWTGRDR